MESLNVAKLREPAKSHDIQNAQSSANYMINMQLAYCIGRIV